VGHIFDLIAHSFDLRHAGQRRAYTIQSLVHRKEMKQSKKVRWFIRCMFRVSHRANRRSKHKRRSNQVGDLLFILKAQPL